MIFEGATHVWREIYMDGRPHPAKGTISIRPTSVTPWGAGRATRWLSTWWDSTKQTWMDYFGHPHTRHAAHRREILAAGQEHAALRGDRFDDPGAHTEAVHASAGTSRWNPTGELDRVHLPGEQQEHLHRLTISGHPIFPGN